MEPIDRQAGTAAPSDTSSIADTSIKIALRPDFKMQVADPEIEPDLEISAQVPGLIDLANKHNLEHQQTFAKWQSTLAVPEADITFLGTGSAIPALTRNVTGILLRVPGHGNYILDCGENTIGQMRRIFPAEELNSILRDLRMIWISHMHADHHLGTVGMIKAWYEAVHGSRPLAEPTSPTDLREQLLQEAAGRRLPVVANLNFQEMIADFAQIEDIGWNRVLPIVHTPADINLADQSILKHTELSIHTRLLGDKSLSNIVIDPELHGKVFGPLDIETVYVKHCRGASGVALTWNPPTSNPLVNGDNHDLQTKPFRVAWSGDCRPSPYLAVIGLDADVLIHECTFGTGFEGQAKAKAHSTMQEAKLVAEAMNAKSLVLTHFSQRYSKLPDMQGLYGGLVGPEAAREQLRRIEGDEVAEDDADEVVDAGDGAEDEPADHVVNGMTTNGTRHEAADAPFIPTTLPTCAAFDYMRTRIHDIPLFQAYAPALVEMFCEPDKKPDPVDETHGEKETYKKRSEVNGKGKGKIKKRRTDDKAPN